MEGRLYADLPGLRSTRGKRGALAPRRACPSQSVGGRLNGRPNAGLTPASRKGSCPIVDSTIVLAESEKEGADLSATPALLVLGPTGCLLERGGCPVSQGCLQLAKLASCSSRRPGCRPAESCDAKEHEQVTGTQNRPDKAKRDDVAEQGEGGVGSHRGVLIQVAAGDVHVTR